MPVFWIRIKKAFEYVSICFSLDNLPLKKIELMLHFCVTTSLNFKPLSLFLGGSLFYFTSNGPCAPTRTLDATEFRHIIPLRTHSQTVDSDHSTNCNWKLVFPSTITQPILHREFSRNLPKQSAVPYFAGGREPAHAMQRLENVLEQLLSSLIGQLGSRWPPIGRNNLEWVRALNTELNRYSDVMF